MVIGTATLHTMNSKANTIENLTHMQRAYCKHAMQCGGCNVIYSDNYSQFTLVFMKDCNDIYGNCVILISDKMENDNAKKSYQK